MRKRTFLLGAAAAGGALVVGWAARAPRSRLVPDTPVPGAPGEVRLNGWVKVTADDRVVVQVPRSEMGQGVLTALAMVLADELDADWSRVATEHPPIDPIYNNLSASVDGLPFHPDDHGWIRRGAERVTARVMREFGVQMTGGSSSVKDTWLPMREAGATARAMLVEAAARRWGVPAAECVARAGAVSHAARGLAARYGELAADASRLPLPQRVPLKTPDRFVLIGRDTPRIERAAKSRGTAAFGIDLRLPGLLYATVRMCPTLGGRVRRFDGAAALARPGVLRVMAVDAFNGGTGGVAVVADTPWHALKGVEAVEVDWEHGPAAGFDSADAMARLVRTARESRGHAFRSVGDVDAALAGAARRIEADYQAPWLAHLTMEPMNCTVRVEADRATVWAPTQVPGLARRAVAAVTGLDPDRVDVQVQLLGGGFGRRLEVDFVAQAAAIARYADGAPVQTFWSRAEDTRHDFLRPAAAAHFEAGFDARGALVAWRNVSAGQSVVHQVLRRQFGLAALGADKTTSEGAFDQAYAFPAARIAHETVDLPVPVGFWRAVGHSHQAFFKEGFLDECAAAAGADPVEFRLALLGDHPRHRAVLQRAARMADWGRASPVAPDGAPRARGVALHESFGSIVAQVAEVSVTADRRIRVHQVWCAVDCGTPVNPAGIRQQMESGVIFGLSAALHGGVTIVRGQVRESNFHDAPVLRSVESPVVTTEILPSTAHPEGVGEPGLPPIAPAVANAVFALTGRRLRSLPLSLA